MQFVLYMPSQMSSILVAEHDNTIFLHRFTTIFCTCWEEKRGIKESQVRLDNIEKTVISVNYLGE